MAKVIMTCGKICSGKTTYAEKMRKELSAVILSVDEIMLAIFDSDAGDKHDEYVARIKNYLFNTDIYEIPPKTRLDIHNSLRREMIEIYSGTNVFG